MKIISLRSQTIPDRVGAYKIRINAIAPGYFLTEI